MLSWRSQPSPAQGPMWANQQQKLPCQDPPNPHHGWIPQEQTPADLGEQHLFKGSRRQAEPMRAWIGYVVSTDGAGAPVPGTDWETV